MTIEERKNEMYKAFEMYLSNEINDAQLVDKLKGALGEEMWFRYYDRDATVNDYRSVGRMLKWDILNWVVKEDMERAIEERTLQLHNDGVRIEGWRPEGLTDNKYAGGGGVGLIEKRKIGNTYTRHRDKKDFVLQDITIQRINENNSTNIYHLMSDDGEKVVLPTLEFTTFFNYSNFAKGGMVKKSDFTMLGVGALIGGIIAFMKK